MDRRVASPGKRDTIWAHKALLKASAAVSILGAFLSVRAFGAKGNGVADDTAAFQSAFNALAGTGVAVWIPQGTYKITSQVNMPSNLLVWGTPGAVIAQALTGAGNVSAFNAVATLGTTQALTATNTPGTKIIQCATQIPNGTRVFVGDNISPGLSGACSTYTVISSVASGPNFNHTLDRPVLGSYAATTSSITPLTNVPSNITIMGNGLKMTGTSGGAVQGYIGFGLAFRCFAFDVVCDGSLGNITASGVGLNFDLGSVECEFVRCRVDGNNQGISGFALQGGERCRLVECEALNCSLAGGGVGFGLYDGFFCDVVDCDGYDNANDVFLGSNNVASTVGVTHARIIGCNFMGSTNGVNMGYGSSYNAVIGCTWSDTGQSAIFVQNVNGPCLGLVLDNVTSIRAGTQAAVFISGNGHEVKVTDLTVQQSFSNGFECTGNSCRITIDGLSTFDAGTDGSAAGVLCNGTSNVTVKRSYQVNTKSFAGSNVWVGFAPQGACTMKIDDAVLEVTGGATTSVAVQNNQVNTTTLLRNVRTVGNVQTGLHATAANTCQVQEGCDFTSCTVTPFQVVSTCVCNMIQGGGLYTDATTTGTVALTHVQASSSSAKFAQALTGNVTYDVPANVRGLLYSVDTSGVTLNGHTFNFGPTGGEVSLSAAQHVVYSDGVNAHIVV